MMKQPLDRRSFLARAAALGAVAVAGGALATGCTSGGGALTCTDTTGLAEADIAGRTALGYVDQSTDAAKNCLNCQLYTPAAEGQCGACSVVKGPIHPQGYCTAWAEKVA
jgi:hypothetical protein